MPYFNYLKSTRRRQLILEFVERYKHLKEIRLVIGEATILGQHFDLPQHIQGTFAHYKFTLKHHIWCKENLVNVITQTKLPSDWKYVAWIDADITFLNKNWALDAIDELKSENSHFIQLFDTMYFMDSSHTKGLMKFSSFGYKHQHNPYEWYMHLFGWHTGFAWACTRKALEKMEGLFDLGIIGSGDTYMALGMINKVDAYFARDFTKKYYQNISKEFYFQMKEFELKWNENKFKLSYVKGAIEHHWHGHHSNRKYDERKEILSKHRYDPTKDLMLDSEGLMSLSEIGERMQEDLKKYFVERNENEI